MFGNCYKTLTFHLDRLTLHLQICRMILCIAAFIGVSRTSTPEKKGGENDGNATGCSNDEKRQNDDEETWRDEAYGNGGDHAERHQDHDGWHDRDGRWHNPHDDGRRSHDHGW